MIRPDLQASLALSARCNRIWPTRRGAPPTRHGQSGAIAIIFVLTLTLTLGSLLMALDLTRVQLAQARLQHSLDAGVDAALARLGANHQHPAQDWEEAISPWLLAAYPRSGFLNSELIGATPTVTVNPDRLVAEASGKIRLISAGLMDLAGADLTARRVVNFNPADLDVVIAIDASTLREPGAGNDPIRQAASQLATQLLQRGGTRVAIVPFSDTIHLGNDPQDWLDPAWRAQPWFNHVWRGCVTEIGPGTLNAQGDLEPHQTIPYDLISQPGHPGALAPLVNRSDGGVTTVVLGLQAAFEKVRQNPNWILPEGALHHAAIDIVNADNNLLDVGFESTNDQTNEGVLHYTVMAPASNCLSRNTLTPFLDDAAALHNHIQQLQADPQSGLLPLGLLWSWRALETRNVGLRRRALVVLSDGHNQPVENAVQVTSQQYTVELNVTLTAIFCPGNPGVGNKNCGKSQGPQDVVVPLTVNVTSVRPRLAVSSLNTHGTAIAQGYHQSAHNDLDDYTRLLCDNLNTLVGPGQTPVYWMTLRDSSLTPEPELIRQCTLYEPSRHRPFLADEVAVAVDGVVTQVMAD